MTVITLLSLCNPRRVLPVQLDKVIMIALFLIMTMVTTTTALGEASGNSIDSTDSLDQPTPAQQAFLGNSGGDLRSALNTECPDLDLGLTATTLCPNAPPGKENIITLLDLKTETLEVIPQGWDPTTLFYGMLHHKNPKLNGGLAETLDELAGEVSFRIHHPFGAETPMNIFMQYHFINQSFLDPACDLQPEALGCPGTASPLYLAGCIEPAIGGTPFTVVTVLFVPPSTHQEVSESLFDLFGKGGQGIEPFPNCPSPNADDPQWLHGGSPVIEYTFKILCDCPEVEATRRD